MLAYKYEDGFCFFLDKSECERLLHNWSLDFPEDTFVMLPIEYFKGLGQHRESNIMGPDYDPFLIALCKEFQVIEPE